MEISKTTEGEKTILTAVGRVDTVTAPELGAAFKKFAGSETTTLDLAGVPYMSSAGLRVLLSAQKMFLAGGGSLTLVNVQAAVKEVLEITGFADILTIA